MKVAIIVDSKLEGEQLRNGLDDPQVRAFVRVVGILGQLASDRARARVLRFIADSIEEQREDREAPPL